MSNSNDRPESADADEAEVVVLNERDAVGPAVRTRRPLTGKALEEARAFLAKTAKLQRLGEETQKHLNADDHADSSGTS